ncbi:MAG: hypothetical protein HKO81_06890 [Flavobacteriaceae bacterium]|nr:hypothetical protein [Bacteroidia bacterium]NNL16350.1 hypothetical protein [Flavobacteriaceae bacterium]
MSTLFCSAQNDLIDIDSIPYRIYPNVNIDKPKLASPFISKNLNEYVVAITREDKYAIIDVTLGNDDKICVQNIIDTLDFPHLAKTGLHSEVNLNSIKTITGRSIEEITELARPNGLSQAGFMAKDETILSVISGDNQIVKKLNTTHPELAKPLFHVLNMMDADLDLNRWNMAKHQWENIRYFFYNNHKVFVDAEDTKGGQKSIFNDNIEGAFFIKIWRELEKEEMKYLEDNYKYLSKDEFNDLVLKLSSLNTGEMEPQYIMRYGFYEGHTYWRTDPITISFIFGLISLPELDGIFENRLLEVLSKHYTE